LILSLFLWFILVLFTRKKCPECWKKIKKDMKICPYCGAKLKRK
jgi:predicted amidophosphoribosyltransferase